MDPHRYCAEKVERSGSSFHYAFRLLEPGPRRAINAVYALCRELDDTVDDPGDPGVARLRLDWWRGEIERLAQGEPQHPVTRALHGLREDFPLDTGLMQTLAEGMQQDLGPVRFADFDGLAHYCHQVAGTVGLMCAEVFGYREPATRDYALALATALQLTNIIRDVGEDARRGRVYLPEDEMERFGVSRRSLLAGQSPPGLAALMAFQAERARKHFRQAFATLPAADRPRQRAGLAMAAIYQALLDEIERDGFAVMQRRVELTPLRKLWLAWRAERHTRP